MKRFLYLLFVVLLATAVKANPVSRSEASVLAASFLNQTSVKLVQTPYAHIYVFNGNHGFVILSADDCAIPVLGYSLEQPFDVDMSVATSEWLNAYDQEIQAVRESGLGATAEVKTAWETLRKGEGLPSVCRLSVPPLVYTKWSQYPPYNQYCPEGSLTGCVATAMAQIMRYWEYPAQGVGSHSYTHPTYGQLSVDFGATTYDWDNMPVKLFDFSSDAAKRAVATLVYNCGVAVETNYGPDASSAPSNNVLDAMPQFFGYSTDIVKVRKNDYTDNQWKRLLMDELDALRPFYYAGQDRYAHAFICDGYSESGYFHFNWGWGGNNDGYYAIGSLTPGQYTFNVQNYAIINIKPANGAAPAVPGPVELDAYPSEYDVALEWWMPVDDPNFTYKVSRNGTLIASGLTQPVYLDENLPAGSYTYEVWASRNGQDSNKKASKEIDLVLIDAVSADPLQGWVEGGGLEEIGFLHSVTAYPSNGFEFIYWMEDGIVVSTEQEYYFGAYENRNLVAHFSGYGVEEDETPTVVYQVEIFTINGIRLESIKENAHGVYLLRLTTDKGIVTKKIVK